MRGGCGGLLGAGMSGLSLGLTRLGLSRLLGPAGGFGLG
jgi:hypothetical protein